MNIIVEAFKSSKVTKFKEHSIFAPDGLLIVFTTKKANAQEIAQKILDASIKDVEFSFEILHQDENEYIGRIDFGAPIVEAPETLGAAAFNDIEVQSEEVTFTDDEK